ncbi:FYVE zinc finger family protein [Brugia malayi]|uniref:FYVE zinc finger family protein n=1 Tax=Brugia malayi TaxID=6279 RepID=A0A4E9EPL0_BRUMA|nr:FYVE zinc finger family protein [Brugia malayi]VIO85840.1 FYVE zinc finger family protein [Brugia malayi]
MNVLELFGFDFSNTLTETQKLTKDYERSNLLLITRLVLRIFLDESMHSRHRIINTEIRPLTDLFVILEKVLWHGFRSSVQKTMIALRAPDSELWSCLGKVASVNADMNESYQCIDRLDKITTPLLRIRAFLRLAVMQKKLGVYFENLVTSNVFRDFYEPWALIRHDECIGLSGTLMALSVLDCNLALDRPQLENQPVTVELAAYVRLPNLSNNPNSEKESDMVDEKSLELALDQKNYLEQRNNYLESKVAELKTKIEEINLSGPNNISLASAATEDTPKMFNDHIAEVEILKKEKEELAQLASEKEDSIRILRQQLADTKKVNVDLYEKIRIVEGKCRQLEKDMISANKRHNHEKQQQQQVIDVLNKKNSMREMDLEQEAGTSEMLKKELADKTDEYMLTLSVLEKKQQELAVANDRLGKLQRQTSELNEKLKQLPVIKQELEELTASYKYKSEKLEDCEKALEELGGHLSESKLKVVELKEELLPLSEAEWEKDGNVLNCKGCNLQFSMSKRKHHCRNCGSIFCNSCTDARVKLPSSAKPVRVCLHCYNLLRWRHNSSLEENSSLNSF